MPNKTSFVFAGTPEFARISLAGLRDAGYHPRLVATQPDNPAGRGRQPAASPVAEYAAKHRMPVAKPGRIEEIIGLIEPPDVFIVAAYGQILPRKVLDWPRHGCINIHPSLLPKYRGASPIPAAILAGDSRTGVTLMQMDTGLDTGPLISFSRVNILADDTAASLSPKLATLGAELVVRTLPDYLRGHVVARPQDDAGASITELLTKDDGRLDWAKPAVYLERQVRAMYPWPVAWTVLDGKPVQILESRLSNGAPTLQPGQFATARELHVGTGQGTLEVTRLRLAGRKEATGAQFLHGYRGQSDNFS